MARRTREEAAATRERILAAAERLFMRRGLDGTSLQQIANAAEVTRGAIYHHFPDKHELYNVIVERVTTPPLAKCGTHPEWCDDAICQLRRYIFGVLERVASEPRARGILELGYGRRGQDGEAELDSSKARVGAASWANEIRRHIALAYDSDLVSRNIEADALSFGIWIMLDGLLRTWTLNSSNFDLLRQARCLIDPYLRALRPSVDRHGAPGPAAVEARLPFEPDRVPRSASRARVPALSI